MLPELQNLPERFVWARKNKGLSQDSLARALGVSQQSIEKLENGFVRKPKYLPEAANILGVPYQWLLDGSGPQNTLEEKQLDLSILEAGLQEKVKQAYEDAKAKQVADKVAINAPLSEWEMQMLQDRLRGKK